MTDAFHEGERAMQARAGETAAAGRNRAMLAGTVIAGARPFIARQSMAALGYADAGGAMWASLLFGKPGFLNTEDGRAVSVEVPMRERDMADPLWGPLSAGREMGMLFIDLGSRRRYRVNGAMVRLDHDGFEVAVREAYPNCPKYIQRRELRLPGNPRPPAQPAGGTVLRDDVERIVTQADTLFVASAHATAGADVSHRGGPPGFARIVNGTTLRIPDYRGNGLFNTLGNIAVDGRAGICIPDFDGGRLLQLTGTARVLYQDDPYGETGGTRRWWEFELERWILRDTPRELAWEYLDASPFNPERTIA